MSTQKHMDLGEDEPGRRFLHLHPVQETGLDLRDAGSDLASTSSCRYGLDDILGCVELQLVRKKGGDGDITATQERALFMGQVCVNSG